MEWLTCYDEIEIIARTEEDIYLLKQLAKKLPRKAIYNYDIGEFEATNSIINGKNVFSMMFYR